MFRMKISTIRLDCLNLYPYAKKKCPQISLLRLRRPSYCYGESAQSECLIVANNPHSFANNKLLHAILYFPPIFFLHKIRFCYHSKCFKPGFPPQFSLPKIDHVKAIIFTPDLNAAHNVQTEVLC